LRVKANSIVEIVTEEEDEAPQIHHRGTVTRYVQGELAVAAEGAAEKHMAPPQRVLDRRLARQLGLGGRALRRGRRSVLRWQSGIGPRRRRGRKVRGRLCG